MKYVLKVNEDGSEIYVHDVHKVLLKILEDIDAICKKHHIPYFLNGGSALGAIRHKGFIPWDDDADIAMMHEDYVKFIDVLKQDLSSEYIFQCFDTHKEYNVLIPAMKIRKKDTYIKEANSLLSNKCKDSDGIFVDVFVYDYCNKNKLYDLPLRLLNQFLMPWIVLIENIGLNPIFLKKWFVNNARLYGKLNKDSEYIGFDLTWTFKSAWNPFIFKKEHIYPVKYVAFEHLQLPVANNAHEYLTVAIAPTYHQLPPKEKRNPKHIVDIKL